MTDVSEQSASATAVIYLRVSTEKQANTGGGEGFSIPAQREACRNEAAKLGAHVSEEFTDAGESARSADRPELAKMLEWIAENRPDYVIIHKIDRLARSRADDVAITLEIRKSGATLVSCTENIDETPSGLLMHGMLSAFAEFYSANLANEVRKGNLQKIKSGGTIGLAPIGFLNVRENLGGREIRTIAVDEERGPLIRSAFERYAEGDTSLRDLLDDLTDQGLNRKAGPKRPAKPLSLSQFQRLLRSPYYKGMVIYKGAAYPGNHEALVSEQTWDTVQARLSARNHAGEKKRSHHHYLKGTVFCGQCGSRLIVSNTKNRHGTIYPYFVCIGRQEKRTNCDQKAMLIASVEQQIEAHYATIQPKPEFLEALHLMIEEELAKQSTVMDKQHRAQERRKAKLLQERTKLLEAHYADAVPIDLLRSEQARIAEELQRADELIDASTARHEHVLTNLRTAVDQVGHWHTSYSEAEPDTGREINQSVFAKILVSEDRPIASEFAEPFHSLLCKEVAVATVERALDSGTTPTWFDSKLKAHYANDSDSIKWPQMATKHQTPPLTRWGLSNCHLVPGVGLEPTRP